jgi:hypothetical protein
VFLARGARGRLQPPLPPWWGPPVIAPVAPCSSPFSPRVAQRLLSPPPRPCRSEPLPSRPSAPSLLPEVSSPCLPFLVPSAPSPSSLCPRRSLELGPVCPRRAAPALTSPTPPRGTACPPHLAPPQLAAAHGRPWRARPGPLPPLLARPAALARPGARRGVPYLGSVLAWPLPRLDARAAPCSGRRGPLADADGPGVALPFPLRAPARRGVARTLSPRPPRGLGAGHPLRTPARGVLSAWRSAWPGATRGRGVPARRARGYGAVGPRRGPATCSRRVRVVCARPCARACSRGALGVLARTCSRRDA